MAPKKRSLRSISDEVPDKETVEHMLLHLQRNDDRTAAIVGASLLESALRDALVRAMDSVAKGLEERLFDARGPLSDFSSMILVAQAFGIITDRLADDLQRIRRIRNCFAHARVPVTFKEPLVEKEVAELVAVLAVRTVHGEKPDSAAARAYKDAKTSYGLSCYITYVVLKSETFASLMRKTTSKKPDQNDVPDADQSS